MPKFNYIAKNKEAKSIKGQEEASSKKELISSLRSRGLFIISLQQEGQKEKEKRELLRKAKGKRGSLKLHDLTFLARNLATTLSSGVTLLRSLKLVINQTESIKLAKALNKCSSDIRGGLSFAEAVKKHPNVFSNLWLGIIKVGESSGNLPFVLNRLADYLEMRMEFERKIKSAMVYPIILIIAAIIAVFIFLKFIFPKFGEVFANFDIELPAITQFIFSLSRFVEQWWLVIGLVLVGSPFLFMRLQKKPGVKRFTDKWILKIPILGNILVLLYIERFTSIVHIMLDSGLTLVYTLDIVSGSIGNTVFQKKLFAAAQAVKEGGSFSDQLSKEGIFPLLVSEMSRIGEETGSMPDVFKKVSQYYQKELTSKIERLIAAFEPIMIILMGIMIGVIVLALFMPLFQLSTLGR